jgi:hypothetical protein
MTRAGQTLQAEIAIYLASDSGRKHMAFARWCRQNSR